MTKPSHRCLKAFHSTMNMPYIIHWGHCLQRILLLTHNILVWLYFMAFWFIFEKGQKPREVPQKHIVAVCTSAGPRCLAPHFLQLMSITCSGIFQFLLNSMVHDVRRIYATCYISPPHFWQVTAVIMVSGKKCTQLTVNNALRLG